MRDSITCASHLFLASLVALLLCPSVRASTWDPHVFPTTASDGPFFEGWYMRAVLPERNESVAVIVGAGLLAENTTDDAIAVYVAILHGDPSTGKTKVYERFSQNLKAVGVTHMGREVTEQPAWDAPPAFRWALHEEEGEGREVVTFSTFDDVAVVRVEAGGAVVKMVAKVTPWSYDGPKRPHSWSDIIDMVPLHWYIHSLSSALLSLELQAPGGPFLSYHSAPWGHSKRPPVNWGLPRGPDPEVDNKDPEVGPKGLVHLEKNWGRAFPSSWVWVQGVMALPPSAAVEEGQAQEGLLTQGLRGARDAAAGGEAIFAVTFSWAVAVGPVHAHLAYVRDTGLGLKWDLKPSNSRVTAHDVAACDNRVHFVAVGREGRELELTVTQPLDSAGSLMGPTKSGFQRLCAESFQAVAVVTLREGGRVLRQNVTIPLVALEFGGDLLCTRGQGEGQAVAR